MSDLRSLYEARTWAFHVLQSVYILDFWFEEVYMNFVGVCKLRKQYLNFLNNRSFA